MSRGSSQERTESQRADAKTGGGRRRPAAARGTVVRAERSKSSRKGGRRGGGTARGGGKSTDKGRTAAGGSGMASRAAAARKARSAPRRKWLPTEMAELGKHRLRQAIGLLLVALAVALALALISFDPLDPSWNRSTAAAPTNWLGAPGSHVADILLQTIGAAAALLCLVAAVWGVRLVAAKRLSPLWWRLLMLPLLLVLAVLALAGLGRLGGWPAENGPGGFFGALLRNALRETLSATEAGIGIWAVSLAAAAAGVVVLLAVLGMPWREWRLVGHGIAVLLGWLTYPFTGRRRQRQSKRGQAKPAEAARAATRTLPERAAAAPAPRETAPRETAARETAARVPAARETAAAPPPPAPEAPEPEPPDAYDVAPAEPAPTPRRPTAKPGKGPPPLVVPGASRRAPAAEAAEPPAKKTAEAPETEGTGNADTPVPAPAGTSKAEAPRARPVVAEPPPRAPARKPKTAAQAALSFDGGGFVLPPLDLLQASPHAGDGGPVDAEALEANARFLETVLEEYGVKGEIVKVHPGPVVTLYELEPAPGTKTARVINLSDDIARSMSAVSVRVSVIPGRSVIGIELPNHTRETVYLRELLESEAFHRTKHKLTLALGKDIGGGPVLTDLSRMPHLLIAGTTGSGKSVGINAMILSLLYRLSPEQCKLIMVDPKMLELSVYDDIPHLLTPVVTDPKKAVVALRWVVREMESRYQAMSKLGVRNIDGFNARVAEATKKKETLTERVQTGLDDAGRPIHEERPLSLEPMPYIVVVIDEMADLMLVAGKDVEAAVQRLAQMARAAGIHLIMATQRPSVDVITGTIKANFPTRISFQVTSKIDSRTILGEQGAEQLLGQGDMLYMAPGGRVTRVHGPFVTDDEVERVVGHLKKQAHPSYIEEITSEDVDDGGDLLSLAAGGDGDDALYDKAVAIVAQEGKCSTSFIQRKLQIGYNRAARLVERMEEEGIVSPANHAGKREVLVGR